MGILRKKQGAHDARPALWGRWDSNPHGLLHMILSHARLPVPPLPRGVGTNYKRQSGFGKGLIEQGVRGTSTT